MGVVKLSTAGILDYQKYSSFLAGNAAFAPSAYDLLETEILTGSQASVTFSSLNSTYGADYQHLQVRMTVRGDTASTSEEEVFMQLNSDTGGNYASHRLRGSGSTVTSTPYTSQTKLRAAFMPRGNETAGNFGATVIDILDPFETTKNTTIRLFNGQGSLGVYLFSGVWINTSALTTILLYPEINNFVAGSRFTLIGLK